MSIDGKTHIASISEALKRKRYDYQRDYRWKRTQGAA